MLRSSSNILLTVINDILDYSKIESDQVSLETVECDADKIVADQAEQIAPQVRRRGLEFQLSRQAGSSPLVLADPGRFRQVLGNLLGNALKFTLKGRITLQIEPTLVREQPHLRISIADTGIGIPREHQDRLFQRFTQADNSTTRLYGGTGLGLAICKRLVELMGGEIGFESEPGSGSTFWFTLPQPAPGENPAALNAPAAAANLPVLAGRLTVLLVEDNFINQELANYHLGKLGCTVTVAPDGAKALEWLHRQAFDLVFMDCMMPEMDGYETTHAIRAWEKQNPDKPHLPIIALTANAMPGDREKCLDAGMDDYLAKPIIAHLLAEKVQRWRPAPTR